jgi:hypothetical protein
LTSKLNIELKKKLIMCYVWSIALYGLVENFSIVVIVYDQVLKCRASAILDYIDI